ncbi:MAG: hypothetical protein BMS9Abin13_313 [Patescibacteria group bacterium]|nr:MAG: hypothetical protein BMS9Abin13_313 [Patescibacteria group bacterium]
MIDLKVLGSALHQLEEERGIPKEKIIEAIEQALAAAYKKDYGKKAQIIRAEFDIDSGKTEFFQVKIVVDESMIRPEEEEAKEESTPADGGKKPVKEKIPSTEAPAGTEVPSAKSPSESRGNPPADEEELIRFNPEHYILLEDARKIKKDAEPEDEIVFPLETQEDYGRIAAQTAKQVIIQKIREAEKVSVIKEFGDKQGEIINGEVQRIERGNIFVDLGKATGVLPYEEQIPGERYKQGERVRAYLYSVEDTPRGISLRLSRSHPKFIEELFAMEAPEVASGVVEIKAIAREAGSRSKIAVTSNDEHIDPVGSCVGQRGVRVSTVMSELGGERIDIIEWSPELAKFVEDALSPAKVMSVELDEENKKALIEVDPDQLSLAIGKGGQNVRLAAKLTGWKIDIKGAEREDLDEEEESGEEDSEKEKPAEESAEEEKSKKVEEESGEKETAPDKASGKDEKVEK